MNLKKILPFEKYTLTTRLPVAEVYKRLSDKTEPKRTFRMLGFNTYAGKEYEGYISTTNFEISRIINYRNSFLPLIKGEITTFLGQTQVNISMKPHGFVIAFMCLWMGIVGLACLGIIAAGIVRFKEVSQTGFSPMLLMPFGMLVFGTLLFTLPFKMESKKSKTFLAELLNAQNPAQ